MNISAALAVSGAILLAAPIQLAALEHSVPRIDVDKHCRAAEKTNGQLLGGVPSSDFFTSCVRDEQVAREQLVRVWATLPAPTKARCVQPLVFSPTYMEWRECVEMDREVELRRAEDQKEATKNGGTDGKSGLRKKLLIRP